MNRISSLRDRTLKGEHGKHRVLMPSDWSVSDTDCSITERKAYALKLMLDNMPIFIDDEELIVGSRTVYAPKHANQVKIDDPSVDASIFIYPQYLNDSEREKFKTNGGWSKGHYVAGYGKILNLGFGGIIEQAKGRLENEPIQEKRDFLSAICIAYQSASNFANRYAELAKKESIDLSGKRKKELEKLAQVCESISVNPPKDLYEALQLFWFAHLALMVENQCLMSFGRFDQYMERFYSGYPKAEAQELLDCIFIKLNDQVDIKQGEGLYGSDNLILSGLKSDGVDGTNDLTYACLNSLEKLALANPQFNIRLHKNSPSELIERVCDLSRKGFGQISYYNDDATIPSLANAGFPVEDAREYVLDACQDIILEGNSDFYLGGAIELTPLLLNVLNETNDNATFDQLIDNYKQRIANAVKGSAEGYIRSLGAPIISPLPFLSGTLDDCIGKGLDVTQGGLKYRDKGMFVMSPVNAVNSLSAIKKVVYEDGFASLADIKDACAKNYEGYDVLRQRLFSAPKWGNDDDRVDLIGKNILEYACLEILKHRIDSEARFLSGIHQPHHVTTGMRISATPDGRRAGDSIPVTLSPVNGTEHRGPTAIIKSVTKIDPMLCQWNSALTLNFHPTAVRGEDGLKKFEILLRTFFDLGGIQLQTNILNVEILRIAQNEPEQYRDLVIRVWGFSAYFVDLSRQYQDEVIARTTLAM